MIAFIKKIKGYFSFVGFSSWAMVACAPQLASRQTFSESQVFSQIRAKTFRITELPISENEQAVMAVAEQPNPGQWQAKVFVHDTLRDPPQWQEVCYSELVTAEEVTDLVWLEPGSTRRLAMVLTLEENPDETRRQVLVFDTLKKCTALLSEQLVIPKPNGIIIVPEGIFSGVDFRQSTQLLRIMDQPNVLLLHGEQNLIDVWASVKVREWSWANADANQQTVLNKEINLLKPRGVHFWWDKQSTTGEQGSDLNGLPELPVLNDERVDTSFCLKAQETGTLIIHSDAEVSLIELWFDRSTAGTEWIFHQEGNAASWQLSLNSDAAPPFQQSFVIGIRQVQSGLDKPRRILALLKQPTTHLSWTIDPSKTERCLQEVKVYGFLKPVL